MKRKELHFFDKEDALVKSTRRKRVKRMSDCWNISIIMEKKVYEQEGLIIDFGDSSKIDNEIPQVRCG